ncbi:MULTISPECIES: sugar ABC transporter substrate-binding protein [Paenibacillus]|uniref:Substrate-binding domain-containing protein n=1 Tax=Paenibacillus campinasensis TaxID=66347 RepID=A0A268ETH2_9BACL|nr:MULTISPECIES: sugar ABC transporter substrate-binding protein [Paenibacillus]MUG67163.1 substrate-binding domain-containing protein [Paenibacillus campinasensis]PAD76410.1 sugar ABC transporter substrate-binding protein [Paenibacillus campinasensis]PAK54952.1 sugar ABC transporter substrate-binding protein [Paenibacillus sp. 7541]
MRVGITAQKLTLLALALVMVLTGCGQSGGTQSSGSAAAKVENLPAGIAEKDEIKLMVVRKIGGDDHTAQFLAGAKQEGEALGFKVDTFSADGDSAKFHDAIAQAIDSGYDGFIISHGDDPATVEDIRKIREKGIPVVTFDSVPEVGEVEGVTQTSQDDEQLAQLALDRLVEEQGPDANIVYLWVDGFPPMVRRNQVYQEVLSNNPGIKELERFGVASNQTSVDTQNAVSALLTKYPAGEIDAIFATWDAFAIGAARAITEAGRNEIKIYGIDVSNADLEIMQNADSPWVATAAVDPKMIGAINVRLLAKKIAGEDTPDTYNLQPTLIDRATLEQAGEEVNMVNLANVIPGWGESTDFEEDWMKALKEANGK